jgi:hypothetical protein
MTSAGVWTRSLRCTRVFCSSFSQAAKADLVADLKASFDYCDPVYESMTDAAGTAKVKWFIVKKAHSKECFSQGCRVRHPRAPRKPFTVLWKSVTVGRSFFIASPKAVLLMSGRPASVQFRQYSR